VFTIDGHQVPEKVQHSPNKITEATEINGNIDNSNSLPKSLFPFAA
jgi:hypothetical protein